MFAILTILTRNQLILFKSKFMFIQYLTIDLIILSRFFNNLLKSLFSDLVYNSIRKWLDLVTKRLISQQIHANKLRLILKLISYSLNNNIVQLAYSLFSNKAYLTWLEDLNTRILCYFFYYLIRMTYPVLYFKW